MKKLTKKELDVAFFRHGFERIPRSKQVIEWKHFGKTDRASIKINRTENALILTHEIWQDGDGVNFGGRWVKVEFGIMAPLLEYVVEACRLYQISLDTRHLNEDWTECHIIPGTNGDEVVDLKTRKITKEKK